MARYIGPKSKVARKFGEPIYGPDKVLERKNFPPGFHGQARRRRKVSEYGTQLKEKQKVKYTYGVLERQFRRLFDKAHRSKGITGEVLLKLLESRLDNVVFRLGIAPSRSAARQLVSHKHITVNGQICNIPSSLLSAGDVVGVVLAAIKSGRSQASCRRQTSTPARNTSDHSVRCAMISTGDTALNSWKYSGNRPHAM